jgi:MoaA/NifB/PqqE/SkfB family radical SAM enzyme
MNLQADMLSLPSMVKTYALRGAIPVFVSWCLTERCNYRCIHCEIPKSPGPEIETGQVLGIIERLRKAGTRVVSFSGGETLLREDIDCVLGQCRKQGMRTRLTSNGALVPQRIDSILQLDVLKLSIDGARETHETMRGKGSFAALLEAISVASRRGLKFVFNMALTKSNIEDAPTVLDFAASHDTLVTFQPLEQRRGLAAEKMDKLMPDVAVYRRLISSLVAEKIRGNPHVGNSLPGLFTLWRWPLTNPVKCQAGRWFLHVDTQGRFSPCDRIGPSDDLLLQRLPLQSCEGCWKNNTLELNLALSGNLPAIRNMLSWK